MDLQNTYLKYTPEITEEVFDRIIKMIEGTGIKVDGSVENNYFGFKKYGRLLMREDGWLTYPVSGELKPITVADILGDWWDKPDTQPTTKLTVDDLLMFLYNYLLLFLMLSLILLLVH